MAQEITVQPGAGEGIDPDSVSSLSLAYVGDSVYELILRTIALKAHNGSAGDLNKYVRQYSNAQAQAVIARLLQDELDEKETAVYKRGRNAKSISVPHNCTISEYRMATGLEALCAYLFLSGRVSRAEELVRTGIEKYKKDSE